MRIYTSLMLLALLLATGCACQDECGDGGCGSGGGRLAGGRNARRAGASYDRPFPLGQVSDSFWETQQTNAEAADFVFLDHEFIGETAVLTPGAKRHLEEVVLRLEHVPFPVVIEQSQFNGKPDLDRARKQTIVENLVKMGVPNVESRVVIASAFAEGFTSIEGERAYYSGITRGGFGGGAGRRFGGTGGAYR